MFQGNQKGVQKDFSQQSLMCHSRKTDTIVISIRCTCGFLQQNICWEKTELSLSSDHTPLWSFYIPNSASDGTQTRLKDVHLLSTLEYS